MLIEENNLTSYTCKCGLYVTPYPGNIPHTCSYSPNYVGHIASNTQSMEQKLDMVNGNLGSVNSNIMLMCDKIQQLIDILKG